MFFARELYCKEVIFKTAYGFIDRAYVHIDIVDDKYEVILKSKDCQEMKEDDLQIKNLEKEFENELVYQETRRIVAEKTKDVRTMLIGRALASTMTSLTEGVICDESSNYTEETDPFKSWFNGNESV